MNTEAPEDFVPDADWMDEHGKDEVGGPGGIANYPTELAPEDWRYVEGVSTPKVT